MAYTESNMMELGMEAPPFNLLNPKIDSFQSLNQLKGINGTIVIFMCNHCPYVIHVIPQLRQLSDFYSTKGFSFIGINSNDITQYPEDNPKKMISLFEEEKINFPYLFDETQEIAKSYEAACTPDTYVFNDKLKLVYRGQIDSSRPKNQKSGDGADLSKVLDAMLSQSEVSKIQYPSGGCNIKWKMNPSN